MGARPIALLDGLRFGAPDWHFRRAVAGIGHYGNCVGVPNVGGETVFDEAYAANCLVNAMCVGLLPDRARPRARRRAAPATCSSSTARPPAATGSAARPCSRARSSARTTTRSGRRCRSATRSRGKELIEVSLELVERGLVESLQDCGAAGLASSLAEMARDGAGVDVHLDRVPLREDGIEPWEIMISESQERMVAVVAPERLARGARPCCARWELPCTRRSAR